MPADDGKDLRTAASQQAHRLVNELVSDLEGLAAASARVLNDQTRATGERLAADALAAAKALAERLRSTEPTLPSGSGSS